MVEYTKIGEIEFADEVENDTIDNILQELRNSGYSFCEEINSYCNPKYIIMKSK